MVEIEDLLKYLMMNSLEEEGGIKRKSVDRLLQKTAKVKSVLLNQIQDHLNQSERQATSDIKRHLALLKEDYDLLCDISKIKIPKYQ